MFPFRPLKGKCIRCRQSNDKSLEGKWGGGIEEYFHSFLTSATEGSKRTTPGYAVLHSTPTKRETVWLPEPVLKLRKELSLVLVGHRRMVPLSPNPYFNYSTSYVISARCCSLKLEIAKKENMSTIRVLTLCHR